MGGRSKGLEVVGDRRIIDRVVAAVRPSCPELLLSANSEDAREWLPGVPVVKDRPGLRGALAGMATALQRGRDVFAAAWDMPFLEPEFVELLTSVARDRDADVVVAQGDGPGGIEPLCGFYSARIAALSDDLARRGEPAWRVAADAARVEVVPLESLAIRFDVDRLFLSVNTDADLARARTLAKARD